MKKINCLQNNCLQNYSLTEAFNGLLNENHQFLAGIEL